MPPPCRHPEGPVVFGFFLSRWVSAAAVLALASQRSCLVSISLSPGPGRLGFADPILLQQPVPRLHLLQQLNSFRKDPFSCSVASRKGGFVTWPIPAMWEDSHFVPEGGQSHFVPKGVPDWGAPLQNLAGKDRFISMSHCVLIDFCSQVISFPGCVDICCINIRTYKSLSNEGTSGLEKNLLGKTQDNVV